MVQPSWLDLTMSASRNSVAIVVLVLMAFCCSSAGGPKPNIVFVLIDDLGFADVGFRTPFFKTPHLDSLALTGLILDRHYVFKYCSPTRASLLTGRWPHHVHQWNIRTNHQLGANVNMTMLPAKLKQAGYATHIVGKWHEGFFEPQYLPVNRGFDTSFGFLSGAADHVSQWRLCAVDNWKNNAPDPRNGTYSTYTYRDELDNIFINHSSNQPLFIYLSLHNVHSPYQAPREWKSIYPAGWICQKCRSYQAMVSLADNITGHLVELLESHNMWNNTIMVVSTDNGGSKCMGNNYPLKGAKGTFFEGGVRALAFVNGGLLDENMRGRKTESFIHIADWYTTFCKLAGVDPSDSGPGKFPVDGQDIWPIIAGVNDTSPHAEIVLGYNFTGKGAIIVGDYKLIVGSQSSSVCASKLWVSADYTFEDVPPPPRPCRPYCLYNIMKDPRELNDLVEKEPEKLQELIEHYNRYGEEPREMQDQGYHRNSDLPVFDDACEYMTEHGGYWQPWNNN